MEMGLKLSKAETEREIDATRYRRNVGCLRYLLHTRPDFSFYIGVLSRYMQSPREPHGVAMKQVLRYLRGSLAYGLSFPRSTTKIPKLCIVTAIITKIQMMVRVQRVTYFTLEIARYPGIHKSKIQLLCRHVKLSLWRGQKLQDKQYGYKTY